MRAPFANFVPEIETVLEGDFFGAPPVRKVNQTSVYTFTGVRVLFPEKIDSRGCVVLVHCATNYHPFTSIVGSPPEPGPELTDMATSIEAKMQSTFWARQTV